MKLKTSYWFQLSNRIKGDSELRRMSQKKKSKIDRTSRNLTKIGEFSLTRITYCYQSNQKTTKATKNINCNQQRHCRTEIFEDHKT